MTKQLDSPLTSQLIPILATTDTKQESRGMYEVFIPLSSNPHKKLKSSC